MRVALPATRHSRRGCADYIGADEGQDRIGRQYVRRNFLCGLRGRERVRLTDLNAQLCAWIANIANQRVHGTRWPYRCAGRENPLACKHPAQAFGPSHARVPTHAPKNRLDTFKQTKPNNTPGLRKAPTTVL